MEGKIRGDTPFVPFFLDHKNHYINMQHLRIYGKNAITPAGEPEPARNRSTPITKVVPVGGN